MLSIGLIFVQWSIFELLLRQLLYGAVEMKTLS